MIHSVKELFEIHINDPVVSLFEIFLRSFDGLVGAPFGSESKAGVRKGSVPLLLQYL
jgi:hypothetical protein